MLGSISGTTIRSISVHNPSVHGKFPLFEGFQNAYSPEIFEDKTYWSESRMEVKKSLASVIALSNERPVQVLMHPFHFSESGSQYRQLFGERLHRFAGELDGIYRPANSTFRRAFPESLNGAWLSPV